MAHPNVTNKHAERQPPSQPVILLVDDYDDGREMYADALTFADLQVIEAANGLDALRLATEHLPDLILMDLSLPGLDGWEVAARLKQNDRTKHLRIIALTAHALDGERERAERAGCDGFISKPCLPDELLKRVRRYLSDFAAAGAGGGTGGTAEG